jgi:hypothetical protein
MDEDTSVTCPHCEEDFNISEVAVWNVCMRCGRIWPPDVQWVSCNWNFYVDCDCPHSYRRYSRDAAIEYAQDKVDNPSIVDAETNQKWVGDYPTTGHD